MAVGGMVGGGIFSTLAGRQALGTVGLGVVTAAAAFSTGSAINSTLFATARLARTVAEDGELPASFDHQNEAGIPDRAVIALGTLAAVLAVAGTLTSLVEAASLAFLFTFTVVSRLAFRERAGMRIVTGFGALAGAAACVALIVRLTRTDPIALALLGLMVLIAMFGRPILLRYVRREDGGPAAAGTPVWHAAAPSPDNRDQANMRAMRKLHSDENPRRQFLKSAAGGLLILKPETVFGSQANSAVEVGLIGCGGRGNWIAPFFPEFTGARVVALADIYRKHLDSTADAFKVDSSRAYHGKYAYRELANSKLDGVVIETPTYYHREAAEAAVEAGKHVFMAKPVAVDVYGCNSVLASAKKAAEKNLTYLVDFQTRAMDYYQEVARRVHRGDIGKPTFAQIYYHANRPVKDRSEPGMDPEYARIINFFMDRELGGDIIVEQNIHVIDVGNWLLNAHPVKAFGTGGRGDWTGTEYDAGDAWDHYLVTYWYPDAIHADFNSHQLTRACNDLCVRCFGQKGCADTHYFGQVRIVGENEWVGTEQGDTFRQGAINNVKTFVDSVRSGKPVNNAETAVESNLTAILGRTAALAGHEVTWDEMMRSNQRYDLSHFKLSYD